MSADPDRRLPARYARGMLEAVRGNSTAYGYSVVITSTFGVLTALHGAPEVRDVFIFLAGAAGGFTLVEAVASGGFRHVERAEPAEVVLLGTAFNIVSMASGLGAATVTGYLVDPWPAWLLAPFAGTSVYLVVVGLEMAIAEAAED